MTPKPDLRKLIDAIQEQTKLAVEALRPHLGTVTLEVEQAMRAVIARAVERGVELQREALEQLDELLPITKRYRRPPKDDD